MKPDYFLVFRGILNISSLNANEILLQTGGKFIFPFPEIRTCVIV